MNDHVYKLLELTGSSSTGIEDAIRRAIAKAHETVRNIQRFEVTETRGHVRDGEVAHWQATLKIGFTLEDRAVDPEAEPCLLAPALVQAGYGKVNGTGPVTTPFTVWVTVNDLSPVRVAVAMPLVAYT